MSRLNYSLCLAVACVFCMGVLLVVVGCCFLCFIDVVVFLCFCLFSNVKLCFETKAKQTLKMSTN